MFNYTKNFLICLYAIHFSVLLKTVNIDSIFFTTLRLRLFSRAFESKFIVCRILGNDERELVFHITSAITVFLITSATVLCSYWRFFTITRVSHNKGKYYRRIHNIICKIIEFILLLDANDSVYNFIGGFFIPPHKNVVSVIFFCRWPRLLQALHNLWKSVP